MEQKLNRQSRLRHTLQTEIPAQVAAIRRSRGWSQQDLAEIVGTTQATVSRLEKPAARTAPPPYVGMLLRLAKAFDVDLVVQFKPWSEAEENHDLKGDRLAVPGYDRESRERGLS